MLYGRKARPRRDHRTDSGHEEARLPAGQDHPLYGASDVPPGVHSDAWRDVGDRSATAAWSGLVEGVAAVVAGALLLAIPDRTLALLAVIFGVYLLCAGLIRMLVIARLPGRHRAIGLLLGALTCGAGIVVLFTPGDSVRVVTVLFAVYLLVSAATAFADASLDRGGRLVNVVSGMLSLAAAAVLLADADAGRGTIAVIVGVYLILAGAINAGGAALGAVTRPAGSPSVRG